MKNSKLLLTLVSLASAATLMANVAAADNNGNSGDQGQGKDHTAAVSTMTVSINGNGRAMVRGTLDAINSNSLTLKSWGGEWTANLSSDTKLTRRFSGASSLSEFKTGDWVQVSGTANPNAAWTVTANAVRDLSIQTRNASFFGTVSNLSGGSFTLTTKNRGDVQVTVNSDAKITVDGKTGAAVSDLKNGMTGSVSGVWDRTQSTVLASRVNMKTPGVKRASFRGSVSSLNGSVFSLTTQSRGTVQVTVNSDARVSVDGKDAAVSNLQNGMNATVSGLWNQTSNAVAANKVIARTPNASSTSQENH